MTTPFSDDDIPKLVSGNIRRVHNVIMCQRCNGTGFVKRESSDYHTPEYKLKPDVCRKCLGDGRMIATKISYTVNLPKDKIEIMPYASHKDEVEPYLEENMWFQLRPNFRDYELEKKYPELAEITYHKYDELAKVCRSLNKLNNNV